jgi:hypothetical protein
VMFVTFVMSNERQWHKSAGIWKEVVKGTHDKTHFPAGTRIGCRCGNPLFLPVCGSFQRCVVRYRVQQVIDVGAVNYEDHVTSGHLSHGSNALS